VLTKPCINKHASCLHKYPTIPISIAIELSGKADGEGVRLGQSVS